MFVKEYTIVYDVECVCVYTRAHLSKMIELRDMVILSSFYGFPVVIFMCTIGESYIALAMFLAMLASAWYHTIVPEHVSNVWGHIQTHGLVDGYISSVVMNTEMGLDARQNEGFYLMLDEAFCFIVVFFVFVRTGFPSMEQCLDILVPLVVFGVGELSMGRTFAILHSLWHVMAPYVVYKVIMETITLEEEKKKK